MYGQVFFFEKVFHITQGFDASICHFTYFFLYIFSSLFIEFDLIYHCRIILQYIYISTQCNANNFYNIVVKTINIVHYECGRLPWSHKYTFTHLPTNIYYFITRKIRQIIAIFSYFCTIRFI